MQRLHEQCTNVLLERCVGNNVDELIEVKAIVSSTKVVLARGANIAIATIKIVNLFGDGLLLLLWKMVDGLLGRVCIFWFFYFWYDFDLQQQDDGFWFFGVGKGSKGGNESGVALARSGSHVEHELAFFNMEWLTTSSQQQIFVLDGMDVTQVVFQ